MSHDSLESARRVAWLSAGALAGSTAIASAVLLPAFAAGPPGVAEFASENAIRWRLGWLASLAGVLSVYPLVARLARLLAPTRASAVVAAGAAGAGVVPDTAVHLWAILSPATSSAAPRLAEAGSAAWATACYAVAIAIVSAAAFRARALPGRATLGVVGLLAAVPALGAATAAAVSGGSLAALVPLAVRPLVAVWAGAAAFVLGSLVEEP